MSSISAISLSGMNAAQSTLSTAATRIARAGTSDQDAAAPSAGSGPASRDTTIDDMVGMLQAKNSFLANLAVFKTADRMTGSLLDTAT